MSTNPIYNVITKNEAEILAQWETEPKVAIRTDLIRGTELKEQLKEFLALFKAAIAQGHFNDLLTEEWSKARELLALLSHSQIAKGFTTSETALFVFSLKRLLSAKISVKAREEVNNRRYGDPLELVGLPWP